MKLEWVVETRMAELARMLRRAFFLAFGTSLRAGLWSGSGRGQRTSLVPAVGRRLARPMQELEPACLRKHLHKGSSVAEAVV